MRPTIITVHNTNCKQLFMAQELMQNCASSQFKDLHIFILEKSHLLQLLNRVIWKHWRNF